MLCSINGVAAQFFGKAWESHICNARALSALYLVKLLFRAQGDNRKNLMEIAIKVWYAYKKVKAR